MPFANDLTRMLAIEHPILLAPMAGIAGGRLAAAVSEAGGLGLIGGGYGDPDWLAGELRAAGNARIGIGFITWKLADNPVALDRALAASPAAVMLSFGEVAPFAETVKAAGRLLICQVQSVAAAREAAAAGADAIVAQGGEAGGHGAARATLPLVPAVVDAVDCPVIAAGGIADGRGLAAALALGAQGVLMGTRFYASEEALSHDKAKQRLVEASGDATVRSSLFDIVRDLPWPEPFDIRTLDNAFFARWRGREDALREEVANQKARYEAAAAAGDFDEAAVIAGEAADLVTAVRPAGTIVAETMAEARTALQAGLAGWRET